MPYISRNDDRRRRLRNGEPASTAGELNYQIFYHTKCYGAESRHLFKKFGSLVKQFLGNTPNYQRYNDMTGALIRCQKEIKRRLKIDVPDLLEIMESYDDEIAKYEDEKIISNGDVE